MRSFFHKYFIGFLCIYTKLIFGGREWLRAYIDLAPAVRGLLDMFPDTFFNSFLMGLSEADLRRERMAACLYRSCARSEGPDSFPDSFFNSFFNSFLILFLKNSPDNCFLLGVKKSRIILLGHTLSPSFNNKDSLWQ